MTKDILNAAIGLAAITPLLVWVFAMTRRAEDDLRECRMNPESDASVMTME